MPTGHYDRKSGSRGQAGKVHNFLLSNVGREVTVSEVANETGLNERQAANAVSYLNRNNLIHLEVIIRGRRWRMLGSAVGVSNHAKLNGRLFEEIAITKSGIILVESEDGEIYKLVELQ